MCTSDGPPKPQEALPPANRSSSTRSSDHSSSGTHKLVNCSRRIVRNLKELTGSEADSEHPVRPHTERRPSRPGPEGRRRDPCPRACLAGCSRAERGGKSKKELVSDASNGLQVFE